MAVIPYENPLDAPGAPMANVGSLGRNSIAELLKRIALNELSGTLEVTAGRTVRTVYFDRGFIVFTASNRKEDRLGQCVLESGRITDSELELAASLMQGRRRIGEAMVEAGLLTEEELGRELAHQARRITTALFSMDEGVYKFEQGDCPIPLELRLGLSIYRIQLEGIRKMKSHELIASALPERDKPVRLSKFPPFSFEDVRFHPTELLVMEAAQSDRSIQGVIDRVGKDEQEVIRTVYSLLSAGILEQADGEHPFKVQEETGGFLLSHLDDEDHGAAENVRQEVLMQFDSLERATDADLLALDPDTESDEEIRKAYEARQREWSEKQKELGDEQTLCVKVEEIQERLARAHERMLQAKKAPESATAPQAVPEPATPEPEFPSSPPTGKLRMSAASADEVKRLMNEIKVRRMVEDSEGTISLLYEVVKLAPGNAKYEAMLAQALGSHPVMKKKAERHFRRALSYDPQNADLHYLLGRYYQSFDMRSRALAEFKTSLRIDQRHAKARAALVELKPEGEGMIQQKLKKLFA